MNLSPDFSDIFAELNAAKARYLLVGGWAVAIHAVPRATKDMDIWVEPSEENAAKVYRALAAYGAPLGGVTVGDFATEGLVFQIGQPPNRIDILTSVDGVAFKVAWVSRHKIKNDRQIIHLISRRHLIQNKLATGRPRDLLDVEELRKYRR